MTLSPIPTCQLNPPAALNSKATLGDSPACIWSQQQSHHPQALVCSTEVGTRSGQPQCAYRARLPTRTQNVQKKKHATPLEELSSQFGKLRPRHASQCQSTSANKVNLRQLPEMSEVELDASYSCGVLPGPCTPVHQPVFCMPAAIPLMVMSSPSFTADR